MPTLLLNGCAFRQTGPRLRPVPSHAGGSWMAMPEPEAGTVAQSKGRRRGARTGCPWDHAAARAGFETRGRAAKKTPSRTDPGRLRRSAARDAAGDSLHAATRARRSQPAGRRRRMRRKEHAGTTGLSRTWCGRGRFAAARPRLRRLERPCAAARGAAPDRELPPRGMPGPLAAAGARQVAARDP